MKLLFLTFENIIEGNGVSKKILSQKRAFEKIGHEVELTSTFIEDGVKYLNIDDRKTLRVGNKVERYLFIYKTYNYLYDYICNNKIKSVYIRYTSFANYSFLHFLKNLSYDEVKIFIEIPTYPYDMEIPTTSIKVAIDKITEKYYRNRLYKYVNKVVTFSQDDRIFNIPTIKMSNAIDFDIIKLRKKNPNHAYVKFTCVATLTFWHGYDRLITAIAEYVKLYPKSVKVCFDVIGEGPALNSLIEQVENLNLQDFVKFYGRKDGAELDEIFEDADICVGSLGRYRNNIKEMKALKNVEYAARGIPFIYSEDNADFDDCDYIYKVPHNDSVIDIFKIINIFKYKEFNPSVIRDSVEHLSWTAQIEKIKI